MLEGLGDQVARMGARTFLANEAARYKAEQGLGDVAGQVLGHAVEKRLLDKTPAKDSHSMLLGSILQHLFNHWLPQHAVMGEVTASPAMRNIGLAPMSSIHTVAESDAPQATDAPTALPPESQVEQLYG